MEIEELKSAQDIKAREVLSRRINLYPPDAAVPEPTEYDLLMWTLEGIYTIPISTTGKYILPGYKINRELIAQLVAQFKLDHGNKNVVPVQFANDSNIVVEPLRPEQFTPDDGGVIMDNYRQTVSVGTVDVIPNADQVAAGADHIVVDEDELFIITDWIDPQSTITCTAIQATVDGELWQPQDMRYQMVGGDLHVYTMDFPIVAENTFDINAKCEFAGTNELTPVGVHVCVGYMIENIT